MSISIKTRFSSYPGIKMMGNKALLRIADFKDLIVNGAERMKQNVATEKMAMMQEDSNQDEMLAEFGLPETSRDVAISRENNLRKLAEELGSLFGENVEVPYWATASASCPSYYM